MFVRFQVLTAASIKMTAELLRSVVWQKCTDVSEALAACHNDRGSKHF
jgi:hypothetical protein